MHIILSPTGITIALSIAALFVFVLSYWAIKERQTTKAEYYGTRNPFYADRSSTHKSYLRAVTDKETPLNQKEQRAYEVLSKAIGDTVWHYSIHFALRQNRESAFRELIRQIKSEGTLVPHVMKNILGEECYRVVMDLEDAS